MADEPIPQELITLARAHLDAVDATRAAARAGEDLAVPMAAERAAVDALYAAREGTEWAGWDAWKRVLEAARAGADA